MCIRDSNLPSDLQEALDDLASRSTGRTTAGEEVRALLEGCLLYTSRCV